MLTSQERQAKALEYLTEQGFEYQLLIKGEGTEYNAVSILSPCKRRNVILDLPLTYVQAKLFVENKL